MTSTMIWGHVVCMVLSEPYNKQPLKIKLNWSNDNNKSQLA
jgi:hypothetical protein